MRWSHSRSTSHPVVRPALGTLASVLTLATPASVRAQASCPHVASDSVAKPAAGVARLRIDAGAGTLRIVGSPDRSTLEVRARRCGSRAEVLAALEARVEVVGDEMRIVVTTPRHLFSRTEGTTARVDLEIGVPRGLAVHVTGLMGDATISGVGALTFSDGLGDLELRGVSGDVVVATGPGDIVVRDVDASLRIDRNVGTVDVASVSGDVTIGAGQTGAITLRGIAGAVRVAAERDGATASRRRGDVPSRQHR